MVSAITSSWTRNRSRKSCPCVSANGQLAPAVERGGRCFQGLASYGRGCALTGGDADPRNLLEDGRTEPGLFAQYTPPLALVRLGAWHSSHQMDCLQTCARSLRTATNEMRSMCLIVAASMPT